MNIRIQQAANLLWKFAAEMVMPLDPYQYLAVCMCMEKELYGGLLHRYVSLMWWIIIPEVTIAQYTSSSLLQLHKSQIQAVNLTSPPRPEICGNDCANCVETQKQKEFGIS